MNHTCIYSFPSNDKTIKELRDRLLRTRGHPQLDQISDINVICGVVKDFLRSLREPLLTFALHETFINAACKSPNESHAFSYGSYGCKYLGSSGLGVSLCLSEGAYFVCVQK